MVTGVRHTEPVPIADVQVRLSQSPAGWVASLTANGERRTAEGTAVCTAIDALVGAIRAEGKGSRGRPKERYRIAVTLC